MIRRCYNPNADHFEDYGLDGIKVCSHWKGTDGFKNFMEDMDKRPAEGYHIDRIDSDYGYTPWNCRWVTARDNMLNRNTTRYITFKDETLCVADWSRRVGGHRGLVTKRLKRGWSVEKALTTPSQRS